MAFFGRPLKSSLIIVLSGFITVRLGQYFLYYTGPQLRVGVQSKAAVDLHQFTSPEPVPTLHQLRLMQSFPNSDSSSSIKSFKAVNPEAPQSLNNGKYPGPKLLQCGWKPEHFNHAFRSGCFLQCNEISADNTTFSNDDSNENISASALICARLSEKATVSSLIPGDLNCLKNFINAHCFGVGNSIPRVAHYVRFGSYNLTLDAFFSMYSVARFFQPCLILLHGDTIPSGPYWRMLLHLVPNIVHVQTDRPLEIFGRKINVVQHSSDVARLKILLEYGGIYLDFDQLLLSSFDNLLNKSTVLGNEYRGVSINNALIVTKPRAEFLRIWLSRYATFNDRKWAEHSTRLPYKLAKQYPNLVHVVNTFFPPLPPASRRFYNRKKIPHHNWNKHYGFHLYTRFMARFFYGKKRIDTQDNAIGDAIRHILYGNQSACVEH